MLQFKPLDARVTEDHLGFIPEFLNPADPRGAVEQIDANYQHGGGWRDSKVGPGGWQVIGMDGLLKYPGDAPLHPYAEAFLPASSQRPQQKVVIYESAFVAVFDQDSDKFRVARID